MDRCQAGKVFLPAISFSQTVETLPKTVIISAKLFRKLNRSRKRSCCLRVPLLLKPIQGRGVFGYPFHFVRRDRLEQNKLFVHSEHGTDSFGGQARKSRPQLLPQLRGSKRAHEPAGRRRRTGGIFSRKWLERLARKNSRAQFYRLRLRRYSNDAETDERHLRTRDQD